MPALTITLYMLGYCMIGVVFDVIYLHTPETVPTEVRSMGMSFANSMARVGTMVAPYIAMIVSIAHFVKYHFNCMFFAPTKNIYTFTFIHIPFIASTLNSVI